MSPRPRPRPRPPRPDLLLAAWRAVGRRLGWPGYRPRPGAVPPPPEGTRRSETMLLAVVDRDRLGRAIDALPVGVDSPLGAPAGTHYARLTVLDPRHRSVPEAMLTLSVTIDGDLGTWVDELLAALGPTAADAIFGACAGWPGPADGSRGGAAWLVGHRVPADLPFGTWEAPRDRIAAALERTAAVRRLAIETQGADPAERQRAFAAADLGSVR